MWIIGLVILVVIMLALTYLAERIRQRDDY